MQDFEINAWFEEEIKPDAVTLQKFDERISEYMVVRKQADELEEQMTELNKKMMKMQSRIMEYLELQGKDKCVLPGGGTLTKVETKKWKAPEGELRLPLIEHLKKVNEYDSVMAFNANKFHSWYQSSLENNPELNFNGVEQTSTKYLKYLKGR